MYGIESLKQSFFSILQKLFSISLHDCATISFTLNTDEKKAQFGDISTNAALIIAKLIGKNPREVANTLVHSFIDTSITKIEIAGPGFLNIFLTNDTFITFAQDILNKKDTFFKKENAQGCYNIEFVSANPTGPLHIGHGRGGIIGDVLARVLKFVGHTVTKEHYVNDAGAQMEKLGMSLKIRCQQHLGQSIEIPEDGYQGDYLKELASECIEEHGHNVIEKENAFFIEYGYKKLLALLQKTLADYNIIFDVWFSERILHPNKIIAALEVLKTQKYLYSKDGAEWFQSTAFGDDKDRVLKKADGSVTYAAADAAYMLDKITRGFDHLIFVLGQDHHSYPRRLEGLKQALGYSNISLECIIYQLVSIKEDGEQMRLSKRAGRIIELADITKMVGSDVARLFYLNRKADAHLEFDINLALSKSDENPVYYLQYAYVRASSILKKAQDHEELQNIDAQDANHLSTQEHILLKKMVDLKELLANISHNYQVHLIAYYLLDLAQTFHNYYHHNRVIEPENISQSRARLLMIILVHEMFDRCLELMGLSKPETM